MVSAAQYAQLPDDGIIIDLSEPSRLNKLMAYHDIASDLSEDEQTRIIDYVWAAFEMSYNVISKRYDHWLEADRAHDVYVPPEATKFREKAVIADTRAVADTVLTYLMSAMTGRNPMFMLEGADRKSRIASALLERTLHKEMRTNFGEAKLAQVFLDSIRYGFAPTKVIWDNNVNSNVIHNFDPRRAFPDPRVTWGDWRRLQFTGYSGVYSYDSIRQEGTYPVLNMRPELRRDPGPTFATRFSANRWRREAGRALSIDPQIQNFRTNARNYHLGNGRTVNELWVRFSGWDVNLPQVNDMWMVITILDEKHVIRCQLNPYGRQFPQVIGGLYSDFHKNFGQSLYDLLLPLHDISTWLLRSRVDNVQAALNNLIFADPTQVNISDLIDRNPWGIVRTLPGTKPGEGVLVAQVQDITRGHWNDIAAIADQKQRISAAADAQQGIPTSDVRTATEIQRLTVLGSKRLGTLSRVISSLTVRPMVEMMISNIQDAITYNGSMRMDPYATPGLLESMVQDGYIDFTVKDLQGKIDYMVVDGTLPTEPTRDPTTWINIIDMMSRTGLGQEYKLGLMGEEAVRAMGVHDLEKFKITKEERSQGPSPSQQFQIMEQMRGANVMPNEEIQNQVQKGNLIPMGSQ